MLYRRTSNKQPHTAFSESHPNPGAGSRQYPRDHVGELSAKLAEQRTIMCGQCDYPIEDYSKIDNCPLCGSDNFLGRDLTKY